jgi:hypothetical protein
MPTDDPYARTTLQGKAADNRTAAAFHWVNAHFSKATGKSLVIVQGCYNGTAVKASAGTHAGGGVIDVSVRGLTRAQRRAAVRWLRRGGWDAWYRPTAPGVWTEHIHAVLDGHRNASPGAQQQMQAYRAGRDGLVSNAVDKAWRPKHRRVFSYRRNKPVAVSSP